MSESAVWERIAAALERLAPPPPKPVDWLSAPGYWWDGFAASAIPQIDALSLTGLIGVEAQKAAVRANIARLASGAAAQDMLRWGARGMGKSALVRASVADVAQEIPDAIAIIQLAPGSLASFPKLIGELAGIARAFLLFVDDLGFGAQGEADNLALRSLLDGGIIARPQHIKVAVTSNRRGIVSRSADESAALHERDERDDALALADRFGLTLAFHPADRATYLAIIRNYIEPLGLSFDEEEAMAFAIQRGNRSGRTALQFATELAGRAGSKL
jgi:predicted AAA+ superfamily ATPase